MKVGKVGCYLHGDGLANVILSDGLANFCNNKEYKGKLRKQVNDMDNQSDQFEQSFALSGAFARFRFMSAQILKYSIAVSTCPSHP